MSRKRDSNWSRDEITVLLDSIMEITTSRSGDGKQTNSKEVFEYAAKKMAEKGHGIRAEKEKCRTKWKKMKEEYTQAKRSREGDTSCKVAPGILPFYDRMEEFVNGKFDNISPHSTIVRRTSNSTNRGSSGMRVSARIAASSNGILSTDNNDTSSTIVTRTNTSTESSSNLHSPSTISPPTRQNSRLSSGSGSNNISNNNNTNINNNRTTTATLSTTELQTGNHQSPTPQHQTIFNGTSGDGCIYTSYSDLTPNSNNDSNNASVKINGSGNSDLRDNSTNQITGHADISYRVSTGSRQITIFGDHDVDIKFRGDCVTINKIVTDFQAAET